MLQRDSAAGRQADSILRVQQRGLSPAGAGAVDGPPARARTCQTRRPILRTEAAHFHLRPEWKRKGRLMRQTQPVEAATLKTCCANLYESDWARLLLGDSFHPGGLMRQRRAASVEVHRREPRKPVMERLAGVFLEVKPRDADGLRLLGRADVQLAA